MYTYIRIYEYIYIQNEYNHSAGTCYQQGPAKHRFGVQSGVFWFVQRPALLSYVLGPTGHLHGPTSTANVVLGVGQQDHAAQPPHF